VEVEWQFSEPHISRVVYLMELFENVMGRAFLTFVYRILVYYVYTRGAVVIVRYMWWVKNVPFFKICNSCTV